jgi:hypothetical protein
MAHSPETGYPLILQRTVSGRRVVLYQNPTERDRTFAISRYAEMDGISLTLVR